MSTSDENQWRVGRHVGRIIYLQAGLDASREGELIGVMDTPALAREVVEAVNAAKAARRAVPQRRT